MPSLRICLHCNEGWARTRADSKRICPNCEKAVHRCNICQKLKPHGDFHRNPSRRNGLDTRCRPCSIGYKLQQRYGIDAAEYARMFELQAGKCAICNLPSIEGQPLVVDHCHVGLQVRGLLCSPCNTAIGLLKDNPSVIQSAAAYVAANQTA